MDSELTRAQHYRDQAANMRALADKETDEEARNALVALAGNYERLYQSCLGRAEGAGGVSGPV
jgi:hypothetical protein